MASFHGWYQKLEDGTVEDLPYDFTKTVEEDITLVAKFSDLWLVLFTNADGKVIYSKDVPTGDAVSAPEIADPTKPGMLFDGWKLVGQDEAYDFGTPVTGNLTLEPIFVESHYVYFNTQGSLQRPKVVKDGQPVEKPANPTREGYDFQGWSLTENSDKADYNFSEPVTSDITLYAVWKAKRVSYTVVYWFEKPNIAGDAGENTGNYAFYDSDATFKAPAGTVVTGDSLSVQGYLADIPHGYYAFGDTAKISGTGRTIVNVYFKRTVYTVEFKLGTSGGKKDKTNNTMTLTV